ncbi:hypothetical protein EVJ58_g5558 [Rhodofomes roseus]|uniref:Signal peptidase I n=1 Tax=Rhodofomes roseus TaxID=34475 RepID=A0A4Y9YDJ2_9APHY|nr:hypothetical protein EVJ58_g5558 [Rhodofomes roseus]
MGVIDVLPKCVSSVYFMYEKKWEKHSLGKLSALREASLAKEMYDTGLTDMGFLYMGFYIHSCPKMRYKGDYAPSYLADPEEYTWCPLEQCRPALEGHRYVSFAHPEHNLEGPPDVPEDDSIQEQELPASVLSEAQIIQTGRRGGAVAVPVITSPQWRRSQERLAISALLNGLGPELAAEVLLFMAYELTIYRRSGLMRQTWTSLRKPWRTFWDAHSTLRRALYPLIWLPTGIVFTQFFYTMKSVSGRSMQPTLNPDTSPWRDLVLFDRFSIRTLRKYERGDIVALASPIDSKLLVKRIVALGGDTVKTLPPHPDAEVRIPPGHVWVEGEIEINIQRGLLADRVLDR